MIRHMSQRDAEQQELPATQVQNISPYVNPAHVLAPPRRWLEAVVSGEYSWPFFRFRYKSLLRDRYRADPERFHALLDASEGSRDLVLTCHCLTDHCHRVVAEEFLARVRDQRPVVRKRQRRAAVDMPPAREWAHGPNPGMVLATLIEHPQVAKAG